MGRLGPRTSLRDRCASNLPSPIVRMWVSAQQKIEYIHCHKIHVASRILQAGHLAKGGGVHLSGFLKQLSIAGASLVSSALNSNNLFGYSKNYFS